MTDLQKVRPEWFYPIAISAFRVSRLKEKRTSYALISKMTLEPFCGKRAEINPDPSENSENFTQDQYTANNHAVYNKNPLQTGIR